MLGKGATGDIAKTKQSKANYNHEYIGLTTFDLTDAVWRTYASQQSH